MATLSLDLRRRIVQTYDEGKGTREEIALRFCVSLGMVKKLLQQRRDTGDIAPRHHCAGRHPKITQAHRQRLKELVYEKPDSTLEELREALGVDCTTVAIHYVLQSMDLTLKKRRSIQKNAIATTYVPNVRNGKKT